MAFGSNNNSAPSTPTKKSTDQQQQLYQQIGGESVIKAACKEFVANLHKDSRTSKAFEKVDQASQIKMISGFIGHVVGGPAYTGPSFYEFHRELALDDSHFEAYVSLLSLSLESFAFSPAAVKVIMDALTKQKVDFLGKEKKAASCGASSGSKCCAAIAKGREFAGCAWESTVKVLKSDCVYVKAAEATAVVGVLTLVGYFAFKALRKN